MLLIYLIYLQTTLGATSSLPHHARLDNGLAQTPPMGWNSYNHYNCFPNEKIIKSNAKAIVDLGLDTLGYRYVTTDCGWGVADRLANGRLTWNETSFPNGFPALGRYIHDLGLLFGVYEDSGIKMCGSPPDNVGSLGHEQEDARTFASWEADSLKYDNCYSDAATGYPNVEYHPSTSPHPRFANMSKALSQVDRPILFQVCEWGIDFPALWAPEVGQTWRIGNDIIPEWRAIFRTLNQAVPQTSFAGPAQWPDLDMLEVGNKIFTIPEEQTHFSLWAILKSPLTIGAALKDDQTAINEDSLGILKQKDVIGYNQDSLGQSASLRRRWTEEGYEVWSGPLTGSRTVAAIINWKDESRELTLDLADIGLQYAGILRNIWDGTSAKNVQTAYTATVAGHGTMLLELQDTTPAGIYPSKLFASTKGNSTVFKSVYGLTSSNNHTMTITFAESSKQSSHVTVHTTASQKAQSVTVPPSIKEITVSISLSAGSSNEIQITHTHPIESIKVTPPAGTYHPSTSFTLSGTAKHITCGTDFCKPVGSKIGNISPDSSASISILATVGSEINSTKYIELDYINNDIAFSSAWEWGSNSRNLTVRVNDQDPVRLEVPLSGQHSELFGPGLGWWDSATLGLLLDGWKEGENQVVIGNEGGEKGSQRFGADFVGVRVFD